MTHLCVTLIYGKNHFKGSLYGAPLNYASVKVNLPLAQRSWRGVNRFHLVRPLVHLSVRRLSVCEKNRVRSVSSTILAGSFSYLHILASNFRRCVALWKTKSFEYLVISLNLNLWFFSCVHVMWMLKVLYCSNFKFSMMIPLDNLLNISYRFGQNCNSVFSAFFFQLYPFYLMFVVASKITLIPLLR